MSAVVVLEPIDIEERVGVPIDFTDEIGADQIDLVSSSIKLLDGVDDDPTGVLDGAPTVVGGLLIVPLRGTVEWADYHIRVKVTTVGGSVIVVPLLLSVRRF